MFQTNWIINRNVNRVEISGPPREFNCSALLGLKALNILQNKILYMVV